MNKTDGNSNQQQKNFNQNSEGHQLIGSTEEIVTEKSTVVLTDKVMNFSNFTWMFLNPNNFFQFELGLFWFYLR